MEYDVPSTDVRVVETWWWYPKPGQSYGTTEALARRAQGIYGGHVEVIRQEVTTTTTVTIEQGRKR